MFKKKASRIPEGIVVHPPRYSNVVPDGLYKALGDEIRDYTSSADKYFVLIGTLGVSCVGVAASPRGSEFTDGLLIAIPFLLLFVLQYVAQLLTEKEARLGLRAAIEDRLAANDAKKSVPTHGAIEKAVSQTRWSVRVTIFYYGLVLLASSGLGLHVLWRITEDQRRWLFWAALIALACLAGNCFVAFSEMVRARSRAEAEFVRLCDNALR